ncbi:MAG: hypothetical protein FWD77_06320 [Betaproteobacteria bacterium]|nr:hypothetical protein [Betaproteobacteria bacterium]
MKFSARRIRLADAPAYLAMSRTVFDRDVRPSLTEIPVGARGIAFDRLDLDAWAEQDKNRNGRPGKDVCKKWELPVHEEFSSTKTEKGSSTRHGGESESSPGSAPSRKRTRNGGSPAKSKDDPARTTAIVDEVLGECLRMARRAT